MSRRNLLTEGQAMLLRVVIRRESDGSNADLMDVSFDSWDDRDSKMSWVPDKQSAAFEEQREHHALVTSCLCLFGRS